MQIKSILNIGYYASSVKLIDNNFSIFSIYIASKLCFNPIQTEGAFDATQELKPYYSWMIASTEFLLREFSSNLPGNQAKKGMITANITTFSFFF